jgi:hypothetical protein
MLEGHGLATSVGDALGAAYNACAITDADPEVLKLLTERASDLRLLTDGSPLNDSP